MMFMFAVLVFLFLNVEKGTVAQCNQLVALTECVCPRQTLIYQCSVVGGTFTVYNGAAFQCIGAEISLRNSEFGSTERTVECNSEEVSITGFGVSSQNNCFRSQLNITLEEGVMETTVSCGVDDGTFNSIGSATITLSAEPFAPPSHILITEVTPEHLTFAWDPVPHNCSSIYYNISTSFPCGRCPTRANGTSITCTDIIVPPTGNLTCTLRVQTVICGDTSASLSGNTSLTSILLKVPTAPDCDITPYYNSEKELIGFNATLFVPDQKVNLSNTIDGSALNFILMAFDSTGRSCTPPSHNPTIIIPISSSDCKGGVCTTYSQRICPPPMTYVTVIASNILGDGMNNTKMIDYTNNFVNIEFHDSKSVSCTFITPKEGMKTCEIQTNEYTERGEGFGNTVSITLDNNVEGLSYNITAIDGDKKVVIQGSTPSPPSTTPVGGIIGGVVGTLLILIGVIMIILLIVLIVRKPTGIDEIRGCEIPRSITRDGMVLQDVETNPLLGYGYYLALEQDEGKQLSPAVNVIARSEDGKLFSGPEIVTNFVDEDGKICPAGERKEKYKNYDLFVQGRDPKLQLRRGSELLHCEKVIKLGSVGLVAHKVENLQEGVKVNCMFEIVDMDEAGLLSTKYNDYFSGRDFQNDSDNGRVFFSAPGVQMVPMEVSMALTHNGDLIKIDQQHRAGLPESWYIFVNVTTDEMLETGSKILCCDSRLKEVPSSFDIIPVEVDHNITGGSIVAYATKKKKSLCKWPHIYTEYNLQDNNQPPDDSKVMALYKNGKLYISSGQDLLPLFIEPGHNGDKRYKPGWIYVFVPVSNDSKVTKGTNLLYCSYTAT